MLKNQQINVLIYITTLKILRGRGITLNWGQRKVAIMGRYATIKIHKLSIKQKQNVNKTKQGESTV